MANVTGKSVRLQIGDGGDPEVFSTVAKGLTDQLSINNSVEEESHKDSGVWRDIAAAGSVTNMQHQSTLIFTDQADVARLMGVAIAEDKSINARIILGEGNRFTGTWFLESFEIDGQQSGNAQVSVSLQSNGEITFEPAV